MGGEAGRKGGSGAAAAAAVRACFTLHGVQDDAARCMASAAYVAEVRQRLVNVHSLARAVACGLRDLQETDQCNEPLAAHKRANHAVWETAAAERLRAQDALARLVPDLP